MQKIIQIAPKINQWMRPLPLLSVEWLWDSMWSTFLFNEKLLFFYFVDNIFFKKKNSTEDAFGCFNRKKKKNKTN